MDFRPVEDRQDVGLGVDEQVELGAGQHDRLGPVLGEVGDDRLQLALALAADPAEHRLVIDDAVDDIDDLRLGRLSVRNENNAQARATQDLGSKILIGLLIKNISCTELRTTWD